MIDQNTIDRIFTAADIVEVISEFVQLKKAGVNYKGLSPFSNEKTPSFIVSPAKGIYKDFSSGKGGNVVGFLMEHEKLSYPDALRYLAKKYNIEIIEKERTEDEVLKENERESLLVITAFAHKYFHNNLKSAEGKAIGLKYLLERGIREDSIEKFQLGYSFSEHNAFSAEALKSGYKQEFLVKSGLSIERNNSLFDRFAGRVMFPIHGLSGSVIGFGGRSLRADKEVAKYLNSPESEIYHKSKILYGLHLARKAIVSNDKCYLVEGYMDVISMHQAGVDNTVASSGTALTVEQVRLIKRFTQNITIVYDGDQAGIKASFRGMDIVLEEGLNVRVVLLPDGEDPDSYSKKQSAADFKNYITLNEKNFISFKSEVLMKDAQSDPVKKANLIIDIVRTISVIPNGITRSVYIKECSTLLNVDESTIYNEVNKIRRKALENKWTGVKQEWAPLDKPSQPVLPYYVDQMYSEFEERELIYFLLKFGNNVLTLPTEDSKKITVAGYIIREVVSDNLEFRNLIYRKVFETVQSLIEKGESIDEKYFIYNEEESIRTLAVDIYTSRYELSKVWRRKDTFIDIPGDNLGTEVPKSVLAYKSKIVIMAINELINKLQAAQAETGSESKSLSEIQGQVMLLNRIKAELSKALGERTIISFMASYKG